MHGEGERARICHSAIREVSQAVRHCLQDALLRAFELGSQTSRTVVGFVHNDSPVHHEKDPSRRGDRSGRPEGCPPGLDSNSEDGNVDTGCLAGASRQRNRVRPGLRSFIATGWSAINSITAAERRTQHLFCQRGLPCEWRCVCLPEFGEVFGEVRMPKLCSQCMGNLIISTRLRCSGVTRMDFVSVCFASLALSLLCFRWPYHVVVAPNFAMWATSTNLPSGQRRYPWVAPTARSI